jgi:hypothetical protein
MPENLLAAEQSSLQPGVRGHRRTLTAICAVLAVIAIGAAVYFRQGQQAALLRLAAARAQASAAERDFKASKSAIDTIVSNLSDSLGRPTGLPVEATAPVLADVEKTLGALATQTDNDPEVRRSQAAMYVEFSSAYLALGNNDLAVKSARKGVDIFRAFAAAEPNSNVMQSNVGLSLAKLGEALRASGDTRGALAADRESLDIARTLADKDIGNKQFRTDVVLALWRLASGGDRPRDRLTEALKLLNNLKLAAMLTPAQEEWIGAIQNDLANQQ